MFVFLIKYYSEADKISKLSSLVCEYIVDQLTQTNLFGHYVDADEDDEDYRDQLLKNENMKNLCKKLVFDDSFDELDKLIRYCLTQHISTIESYEDDLSVIVSFIINELAYAIYHDLTIDSMNNSNNNNTYRNSKDSLLFPKLLKMFKLIYNLSCYICCYPFESDEEYFYVNQDFHLRNTLYKNIFGTNTEQNKEISCVASNCAITIISIILRVMIVYYTKSVNMVIVNIVKY